MTAVEALLERQMQLYGLVQRAVTNLRKAGPKDMTISRVESRLETLEANWAKFQENHERLIVAKHTKGGEVLSESDYFQDDIYSLCEEGFLDSKTEMKVTLSKLNPQCPPTDDSNSNPTATQNRRLPKIDLPKFNGKFTDWTPFRDLFISMVNANTSLSAVEKLHYLKTCLTGEPAQLIKNITVSGDNYVRAWDTLTARYENKRLLVDSYLATLFSIPCLTQEASSGLKCLLGDTKEALGALAALGSPINQWDHLLVHMTVRKLDPESLKDWEKRVGENNDPATFDELEKFIVGRIHTLEAIEQAQLQASKGKSAPTHSKASSISTKAHTAQAKERSCASCKENHYIASCPGFRSKPVNERKDFVISKNLCFNCLGSHRMKECRSTKRCQICQGHHNTLLHNSPRAENAGSSTNPSQTIAETSTQSTTSPVVSHTAQPKIIPRTPVLLATALVTVSHPQTGESLEVRALLDQGSESSFVTESLSQQLRLPRHHGTIPVIGVGAQQSCVTRGLASLILRSRTDSSFSCQVDALVLPRLTSFLPSFRLLVEDWPHFRGLQLADPSFAHPNKVDVILGADVYSHVILEGLRKGGPMTPIAMETRLGWVLSGSVALKDTEPHRAPIQGFQCSLDYELTELVQRFWSQEEITKPTQLSPEENKCEQHFRDTVSRDNSGRYIVRLPFKNRDTILGDSHSRALCMLSRMEKRFTTDSSLKEAYSKFLREYAELGHMQRAMHGPHDISRAFYLPHHGVVRESSSTTKLRVVFNGSQKTNLGLSLNDNLLVGPKILNDLADVLLRWRRYPVAFSSDIAKMYRQILVHEDDRDWQRILWREDNQSQVNEYRLCTVTYGLASAPYLAIRSLHQLVDDEGARFPLASNAILHETYVDDVLTGAKEVTQGREKISQIIQLLRAGGFDLQKWTASHSELLEDIAPEKKEASSHLLLDQSPTFRALGLVWKPDEDSFAFAPQISMSLSHPTKRKVLSQLAQLFDPLGWLAPVTIRAKIFLQELWTLGLEWDEELSETLATRWNVFLQELQGASSISISRWMGLYESNFNIEIHGFSDASQAAMAAVVYLRVHPDFGDVKVTLVCAKTKVAPLKRVTIPRLELCAALLLVRLVRFLERVLDWKDVPVHLWTDSTVALAWIRSHPSLRKDFVRNRVTEIQELTKARWHHVSGNENPTDLATRGAASEQVHISKLWQSGPSWLAKPSVCWPSSSATPKPDDDLEVRHRVNANLAKTKPVLMWDLIDRFSRLSGLLRITAQCWRVIRKWRARCAKSHSAQYAGPLATQDLNEAMLFWTHATQQAYFAEEIRQIKKGSSLARSHPLARLAPFLDSNENLRVGGRLQRSQLPYDKRHPLILPRDSSFSTLVIDHYHKLTLHGGAQLTLASIRQRFWVLGGRVPIRALIYRCIPCARQRAILSTQLMGQLPPSRVAQSRPFLHSGIDYAGPFTIRAFRGRTTKTYKGYIIIFVCFATSAVHLELASDYSTNAFIAAFKRFTGRRGIPATLRSDCGRNLIGADVELRRMLTEASAESTRIADALATHGTQWLFNPPSAPHFGGKWEAGVKSVKFHLKRVVGEVILTFEEFTTFLAQIEATLNSRPLCALSDDSTDLDVLTPGHFLIGTALNTVPEPSLADAPLKRLSRWQQGRQMAEHFWKRWSADYPQSLQSLSKWRTRQINIKIGDIVLVKDDNRPPAVWPLAKVIDVHPGADGVVRAVTIKTQSSTLKRSIVKLCVLPLATDP